MSLATCPCQSSQGPWGRSPGGWYGGADSGSRLQVGLGHLQSSDLGLAFAFLNLGFLICKMGLRTAPKDKQLPARGLAYTRSPLEAVLTHGRGSVG